MLKISKITLTHRVGPTYRIVAKDVGRSLQELMDDLPRAEHPLLFEHPIAGKTLIISPLYTNDNLSQEDEHLVASLLTHIYASAFSHRWLPGDIVVWDNRVVLHSAPGYSGTERRRLMRIVINEQ